MGKGGGIAAGIRPEGVQTKVGAARCVVEEMPGVAAGDPDAVNVAPAGDADRDRRTHRHGQREGRVLQGRVNGVALSL
ncbi:MAG: hypothetical protein HS126_22115 [Anaerolineales bacterium]|nr:hypothetical protein [Anaerolineales bacterium]